MEIVEKALTDAFVLKPRVFNDDRGYFYESYNEEVFESLTGIKANFIQDNQSYSSKGTLRGLHFQKGEAAQAKLVRVTKGSAYDVAVDLRPDSPTFKQWYGVELTEDNHLQFFIPRGFAHGFSVLSETAVFNYKCDNLYNKELNPGGVEANQANNFSKLSLSELLLALSLLIRNSIISSLLALFELIESSITFNISFSSLSHFFSSPSVSYIQSSSISVGRVSAWATGASTSQL